MKNTLKCIKEKTNNQTQKMCNDTREYVSKQINDLLNKMFNKPKEDQNS